MVVFTEVHGALIKVLVIRGKRKVVERGARRTLDQRSVTMPPHNTCSRKAGKLLSLSLEKTWSIRARRESMPWAISPSQFAPPMMVVICGSISLHRFSSATLDVICSNEHVAPTTFGAMDRTIFPSRRSHGSTADTIDERRLDVR